MRPLKDRLLVKQVEAKDKSAGGIFLPQGKETYDNQGVVMAAGPEVKDVKVGDKVIFTRRPASHLGDNHPNLQGWLVLKEEDIVALIESD